MATYTRSNRFSPTINRLQMQQSAKVPSPPMFGVNQPLPLPGMQQGRELYGPSPIAQPPQANDFVKEYNDVLGNRPDRMAYRDEIEAGAPQINRSKWARLGAALVAGGSTAKTGDPAAGYNLAMSSYFEPQRRSDERWKEKMTGLGNLATMEDSDVKDRLRAIELKNQDKYNAAQESRAADVHGPTMESLRQSVSDADRDVRKGVDGWTRVYSKRDGHLINEYKSDQSPQEKQEDELEQRQVAGEWAAFTAGNRGGNDTSLKERVQSAGLDIRADMAAAGIPSNYLSSDADGLPTVAYGKHAWSQKSTVDYIDATNAIINKRMNEARTGGSSGGGRMAAPSGGNRFGPYGTGRGGKNITGGGAPTGSEGYVGEAGEPGTVTLIGPDGNKFGAKPEEVDMWLGLGEGVRRDTAAPATANEPNAPAFPKEALITPEVAKPTTAASTGFAPAAPTTIKVPGTTGRPAGWTPPNKLDMPATTGRMAPTGRQQAQPGFGTSSPISAAANAIFSNKPKPAPAPFVPEDMGATSNRAVANQQMMGARVPPNPIQLAMPGPAPNMGVSPRVTPPGFGSNNVPQQPPPVKPNPADLGVPLNLPPQVPQGLQYRGVPPDLGIPMNVPNQAAPLPAPVVPAGNPPPRTMPPAAPPNLGATSNRGVANQQMMANPIQIAPPPAPKKANPIQIAPPPIPTAKNLGATPNRAVANLKMMAEREAAKKNNGKAGAKKISPAAAEMGDNDPVNQFTGKVQGVMDKVKKETGLNLVILSGKRSAKEQADLYAKGRTAGGNIVTNADGVNKQSSHQRGTAADIRFHDDKGKEVKVYDDKGRILPDKKKIVESFGRIAKEQGLTWGGDWTSPYDPLHIQLEPVNRNR